MRSSQIKFGETFAIMVVVIVMIMIGLSWYNSKSQESISELKEENQKRLSIERFSYIVNNAFLHENIKGQVKTTLDYHNIMALKLHIEHDIQAKDNFRKIMGEGKITIKILKKGDLFEDGITFDASYFTNFQAHNPAQHEGILIEFYKEEIPQGVDYDIHSFRTLLPIKKDGEILAAIIETEHYYRV